jgi:2-polyprenyl-6-methoxyphenol hydroxylase-like FAD-dependent oxidoreductase
MRPRVGGDMGGGISGLAAAQRLVERDANVDVLLLEHVRPRVTDVSSELARIASITSTDAGRWTPTG